MASIYTDTLLYDSRARRIGAYPRGTNGRPSTVGELISNIQRVYGSANQLPEVLTDQSTIVHHSHPNGEHIAVVYNKTSKNGIVASRTDGVWSVRNTKHAWHILQAADMLIYTSAGRLTIDIK